MEESPDTRDSVQTVAGNARTGNPRDANRDAKTRERRGVQHRFLLSGKVAGIPRFDLGNSKGRTFAKIKSGAGRIH